MWKPSGNNSTTSIARRQIMSYLSPKTIIVDFLRKNVSDPRKRLSETSDTFTATAAQTSFTLTPESGNRWSYIKSITIDGTPSVKWRDYYIDQKNQKIIFFSAMTGAEVIIITYGEGTTDWIYPAKPKKKLNALAFPRINITIIGAPGNRMGNYEAPVEAIPRVQVHIWCKEKQDGQIFEIDGDKYTGEDLAEYIGWQITKAFEDNEDELFPAMYGYDALGMGPDLPFDEETQCHHKVVEFLIRGLKLGRIS